MGEMGHSPSVVDHADEHLLGPCLSNEPPHVILDAVAEEVDKVGEPRWASAGRDDAAGESTAVAATVNVEVRWTRLALPEGEGGGGGEGGVEVGGAPRT